MKRRKELSRDLEVWLERYGGVYRSMWSFAARSYLIRAVLGISKIIDKCVKHCESFKPIRISLGNF